MIKDAELTLNFRSLELCQQETDVTLNKFKLASKNNKKLWERTEVNRTTVTEICNPYRDLLI